MSDFLSVRLESNWLNLSFISGLFAVSKAGKGKSKKKQRGSNSESEEYYAGTKKLFWSSISSVY